MAHEKRTYNMIDLYKWISSLFVIAIHTQLFLDTTGQGGAAENILALVFYPLFKAAVPFFFIIAAYFAGLKIDWSRDSDENARVFENNAARILKMYLIWILIYLIPTGLHVFQGDLSRKNSIWYLILTAFLGGNAYCIHLWFLLGLGISFVILLLACGRKLDHLKWVFAASILLYGIRALEIYMPMDVPDGLFGYIVNGFQFPLFSALFYCTFGLILAKHDEYVRERISFPVKLVILLAGYIIAVFNANQDLFGILLHLALPVFLLSVNLKGNPKVFLMLRKLSTDVYLIHMLVMYAVSFVYGSYMGMIPFLLTAVISNLLSLIYLLIKDGRIKKK